jgi:hypothetical protein
MDQLMSRLRSLRIASYLPSASSPIGHVDKTPIIVDRHLDLKIG